ncbi:protein toll-like [Drosophila miranda]|uniref:protein toll-like n=1 Tax=Drosophila miranda TaxID=7229 RepID=UPI00143FAB60|nr:protein toll-like [Drosophila miranda]
MDNLKTIQIRYEGSSQTPEFWMEDGTFKGKTQLNLLTFQGLKMENLTSNTFGDLKSLKILNFTNTIVRNQSFLSSENLQKTLELFVLSGKEIVIETRYFESYSRLKFIHGSIFNTHENITAFMCKENSFYCLFTRGVHGRRCPEVCECRYRRYEREFMIDCSERNLNEIPPLPRPITGCPTLNFRGNNLRHLPSQSTLGYNHLIRLDVSDNKLHNLEINQLPVHLEHLNIGFNNISTLNKKLVDYMAKNISLNSFGNLFFPYCDEKPSSDYYNFTLTFQEGNHSQIHNFLIERGRNMHLTDDPWHCFWKMTTFLLILRGRVNHARKHAAALEFSHFDGECPDDCICLRNYYSMEFIVDCSGEDLSEIPPLPIPMYSGPTTLLFQNNKLRVLPNDSMPGYASVGRLFLDNNRLTELDNLPRNLSYLDIRNNRIAIINRKTLDIFEKRTKSSDLKLFLSGNPWACTCEEKDFLGFVKGGGPRIGDVTNITCGDTGNLLIEADESSVCPSGFVHYVTLTVSFMLMILTINLMIYFKQPLLIWFFEHGVCLSLAARRELDERKKFDAFLSFTHKDEDLVEEFVERLENGSQKFQLCFYLRDWLLGVSIPECISQSVKDSRRIIILMTNHFLKSTWGRLEFRLALHATSQDRCKRLIVVLYPEVENFDDLDSELRTYMVLNTYLKRDDPNFWNKLIYSMPHIKVQHRVKWTDHDVIQFS